MLTCTDTLHLALSQHAGIEPPTPADNKKGGTTMMVKLVHRYIAERQRRGEIGEQAARGTRYRLYDLGDHTPDDPKRVTRRHIERWMERPDLAAGTRQLRLSAARGFCQWCVLNGHMRHDPTLGIKAPKAPMRQPRNLHATESPLLLEHAPDARARLIVLLMLQEGLRCVEVSRAQVGDIDRVRATIEVRGKGSGGHVSRTVPMSTETLRALDTYLLEHPAPAGPLVRSYVHPGRPVGAKYISSKVAEWMTEAGVKHVARDGKSAHSCRHTAASDMVESGADVLQVQRALGHRSILSTQVYLRGVTPDLRAAMAGRTYLR